TRTSTGEEELLGLRGALDRAYARVRSCARADWERHYAGKDPADYCVSVRVEPGDQRLTA
ncbi:MAG: hypothetical protein ACREF8_01455, partial [Chthoniobacterales bacterium]